MKVSVRSKSGPITIEHDKGGLKITAPYNDQFREMIKHEIPARSRSYDRPNWIVDAKLAKELQAIIQQCYNVQIDIPNITASQQPETMMFIAEYVGACKIRMNGLPSPSAMAFCDGGWALVLPENVLRAFFEKTGGNDKESYYDILCIDQVATSIEIKVAYRRMAKQWHPDTCKEPGAKAIFQNIAAAYEILSNPTKRKKYNAALKFENDIDKQHRNERNYAVRYEEYRSPLRCGIIVCDGTYAVAGKFIASTILIWNDITDDQGRTMTSFWSKDLENFVVEWV